MLRVLQRHLFITSWALAVVGCQVYDPDLVDAGRDAGEAPPCNSRRPPVRPEMPDGDDGEEYLFGLAEVFLDQEEEWRNIGFDLDEVCTVEPTFETECRPMRRSQPPSDGNDGIDNVFGSDLFPLVEIAVTGLQDTARAAAEDGTMPLMRLRGWNGEDDDRRVDVTITSAIYAVPADPMTGEIPTFDVVDFKPQVGGMPFRPIFDGNDYAFLREDTFFEGDPERPLIRDDNAYVAGRYVVARLPDRFEIVFPSMTVGVVVTLTDGIAVGRISDDLMMLEDVVVGGRWAILDLLSTAENVGLCMGDDNYNLLVGTLDRIADVRAQPGSGGEGVVCDAVSAGVTFVGRRVQYGGLVPGPAVIDQCSGDGGVPDAGSMGMDGGVPSDGGP